jgi:tetratricopeptide (TPR) repeat protein
LSPSRSIGKKSTRSGDSQRNPPAIPDPAKAGDLRLTLPFCALVVVVAFAAYWPALSGGFLWDDDVLLTANAQVHASDGLQRLWLTNEAVDYWPVTGTSFWLEWRLWGLTSTGYHVTNLLLHVGSCLLLWALLRRLSVPGAELAALLFAVHPMNVESVAWIAQRKNTLSMFFYMLSIFWYLRDGRWYFPSLVAFVAAMLSKGSVAVLPAMLLVIQWWRHGRITSRDLVRLAPFAVVSIGLTLLNISMQTHRTASAIRDVGLLDRVLAAGAVIWFYLFKALVPINLTFIYPQWTIRATEPSWWLPLAAAGAVTALLVWKRDVPVVRALLVAWVLFCCALAPVMGFVDVYFMRYSLVSDHYAYIALLVVVSVVAALCAAIPQPRLFQFTGALLVAVFGIATWQQSHEYADAATLYTATLRKNPRCWLCETNLAVPLVASGTPETLQQAIEHLTAAVRMNPDQPETHSGLGVALQKSGRLAEAIAEYQRAIVLNPRFGEARANLATAREAWANELAAAGRYKEAIGQFEQLVKESPAMATADTHDAMAEVWRRLGDPARALSEYVEVVRLVPASADAHNNLGSALLDANRPAEAVREFREAVRLDPTSATGHRNLGVALELVNQFDEAAQHLREALRLQPKFDDARAHLEELEARSKRK